VPCEVTADDVEACWTVFDLARLRGVEKMQAMRRALEEFADRKQSEEDPKMPPDDSPKDPFPSAEGAVGLHDLFVSLVSAGFAERQALYLIGQMMQGVGGTAQ
jgi:hypothetical protein